MYNSRQENHHNPSLSLSLQNFRCKFASDEITATDLPFLFGSAVIKGLQSIIKSQIWHIEETHQNRIMIQQEIVKHFVMYVGLAMESHSWLEHQYSSDTASLVIKNGHPKDTHYD